jgi:hypothetical protein
MMRRCLTVLAAFAAGVLASQLLSGPAEARQDTLALDQTDPVAVVEAVFDAARGGNLSSLSGLCPPGGGNDDATQRICDLTPDHADADAFAAVFSTGRVEGMPLHTAHVPFVYGPDGETRERMELIQRSDRWYLFTF